MFSINVKLKFSIVFIIINFLTIDAQIVSNVSFKQEHSNIVVSYYLETKTPSKIDLYISINAGKTWQGPLKQVKGDVGDQKNSGAKIITWNVLEELEELRGSNIMFQVRAEDSIKIVKVGTQYWTNVNLNVSKYRNGDVIPEVRDPQEWSELTTGAWCYYNNNDDNDKLYNWYAVNDPRGLAPKGFHIPDQNEFETLFKTLEIKKEAPDNQPDNYKYVVWKCPINIKTMELGFSNLHGGNFRYSYGDFAGFNDNSDFGVWWVNDRHNKNNSYLNINTAYNSSSLSNKKNGYLVRCIKD
jgi:uncharacterized protein (TIGR02145 family)